MHYHLNKYIISNLTNFLRRIFRYNTQWTNAGVEIVQFSSGSEQLVFEQFFNENEKYPVVTIGSLGGNTIPYGFNDFVTTGENSVEYTGSRNLDKVTLSETAPVLYSLSSNLLNETLKAVSIKAAFTGTGIEGNDIDVLLYENYKTTPTIVSSGAIPGTFELTFQDLETEMCPSVVLSGQDYWISLQTSSGSNYYIGIDSNKTTKYISGDPAVESTGSVVGLVRKPTSLTYGGMYEGSLTFRCMSKNQTAQAYDLSELIMQYMSLGKHAGISRDSNAVNGLKMPTISYENTAGILTIAGINVKNIRIGGVENRRRGEKDLIFTVPVTLDFMSEWSQQFSAEYLKGTSVTLTEFYESL